MPRKTPEELEKLIHQTLRSLPDRRAPRSLEARVLAAIETRQSLAWWRQSFAHWPLAARAAFLVVTGVLAAALIGLFFRSGSTVNPSAVLSGPAAFFAHLKSIASGLTGFGALLFRSIPVLWIYGGLAFFAAMYAALIGLGATAYRTLFNDR